MLSIRSQLLFLLIFVFGPCASAQVKDKAIKGVFENDWFLFTDRYYTTGLSISYSTLLPKDLNVLNILASKEEKTIISFAYDVQIYTPSDIEDPDSNDRPYAGYQGLSINTASVSSKGLLKELEIDLGIIGPSSGVGSFHQWWHDKINYNRPQGWNSQIEDQLIVNVHYKAVKNIPLTEFLDIVTGAEAILGTGNIGVYPKLMMRFGEIGDFLQSGLFDLRLGEEVFKREDFFFYSISPGLVFHNAIISGRTRIEQQDYTAEPFLLKQQWGYVNSGSKTSLAIIVNGLSKEINGADPHFYATIAFSYLF